MKLSRIEIVKAVIACLLLILFGAMFQRNLNDRQSEKEQVLDGGWSVSLYGVQYQDVTLSQFELPYVHKGSRVVLERPMEQTAYAQSALRIQSRYSVIEVYLNDEMIYHNGDVAYERGYVLGNGYHWIALPADYAGTKLSIVYLTGEDEAFSSFDEVLILDSPESYGSLFSANLITGIIACCLCAIGMISIMCAAVVMGKKHSRSKMLLWLGMFSLFVGVWMLCNSKLAQIVTENLTAICYSEYISMYLACISMLMFVASFFKKEKNKRMAMWFAGGFTILSTLLLILNITNIRHFPKTVLSFQVTALLLSLYIIVILFKENKEQQRAERTFLIGIGSFFLCAVLELVRYRYNKLCLPANALQQSMIPIGALFFILAMFGSFFYRIMERVAENMERKTLYDMAYQDALTNIRNRAWCEKLMHDYETVSKPMTLINMDLNKFKSVNDNYGHAVGDELLIRFAAILTGVFRENDSIGRMGGDEFIVILEYLPDEIIEEHIQRLLQKIEEENRKGYPYQISVSYGYASDETGHDMTPWELYEEADRRMYRCKQMAHGV